ncbi:MAG: GspE/PulE family protein [Patescibacteria group bacterium]|nr:GspE/PulE family protein [Patescibacteria group bacterium]
MPDDVIQPTTSPKTDQNPSVSEVASPSPPQQQMVSDAQNIVDILLNERLLTPVQAEEVKVKSASENKKAEDVLKSLNIVPEEKISEAKAKLLGIPFISLTTASFSPQALSFIPRAVAERFNVIPFLYDEKTRSLSVAMGNPVDLEAISFLQQKTGLNIKVFAAAPNEVAEAIGAQYRQELVSEVGQAIKETEEFNKVKTIDSKEISQIIKEAPIAKIVSTILEYAVTSRASDVHIEPQEDRVRVRYRIDGILYDRLSLPRTVQDAVISRIKILSEMKIDEHRTPQDGRFNFKVGDQEVDLRISVLPTVFGEKIVMRLLRKSGGIPTLPELGLAGTALKNLETTILRPHGIIIVCGPTGSGKTTTLYSVLSKLNTTRVNIMSLEDPVEYQIPGVNQVQINPAVGLTFATGLRSFLRQDPNIILVGEIRDGETADLAIQAALTGHLVFSTLHTSNASGALPRLLDLGAENFLLASTMNGIVGQRIVRKICPDCKEAYVPSAEIIGEMKNVLGKLFPEKPEIKLYKGKGCAECGSSGYTGRVGIFEVLPVTEKIAHLVLERADSTTIEKKATEEGMITMKQDGYLKVLNGTTTVEEVLRVAQE